MDETLEELTPDEHYELRDCTNRVHRLADKLILNNQKEAGAILIARIGTPLAKLKRFVTGTGKTHVVKKK